MKFMHLEEKSCIKRKKLSTRQQENFGTPKKLSMHEQVFFLMHSNEFPNPSVNKKNRILVSTKNPDPCSRKTK